MTSKAAPPGTNSTDHRRIAPQRHPDSPRSVSPAPTPPPGPRPPPAKPTCGGGRAARLLRPTGGDGAAGGRRREEVRGWREQCLGGYRAAERGVVAGREVRLAAGERGQLARGYRPAGGGRPPRPDPR